MADISRRIARWRVPLGFVFGAVVLGLAQPTWPRLAAGCALAAAGEALRFWAAGHLEKGREVTQSGPYRFLSHPLYAGSAVMGIGLAVAAATIPSSVLIGLYLGLTLRAAARTEEAALRARFGDEYERYQRGSLGDRARRRFSLARAIANREHRTVVGVVLVLGILALKTVWVD